MDQISYSFVDRPPEDSGFPSSDEYLQDIVIRPISSHDDKSREDSVTQRFNDRFHQFTPLKI